MCVRERVIYIYISGGARISPSTVGFGGRPDGLRRFRVKGCAAKIFLLGVSLAVSTE